MADLREELNALRIQVAELTRRVYRLELEAGAVKETPTAERIESSVLRTVVAETTPQPPSPPPVPAPVKPALKARDLESVIGSQWLNRIGIIALMIGAAYFLKLAFDNNWIGPSGRVAIGLISGTGLVAWSSRLHAKGYKYFAHSLTALGIGIMYLSLWAAFQLYHLIPASAAFVAMIIVTVSASVLALRMEAQILAAVALAGGFSTPLLLSTGQNRPVELFSYLAMLDLFAIILVTVRPWRQLLSGAFVATAVYYIGWSLKFYSLPQRPVATAFATAFFVMFAVLPLVRRIQLPIADEAKSARHVRSKTLVAIALLNPILYFFELYAMYEGDHQDALAWVALALAAAYIGLSGKLRTDLETLPENQQFEKWLHLAIAIGFLTLAIPLKLDTYWITIGWLVEAAALLWVGTRSDIAFLKNAAVAALGLGVFRLLFLDDYHSTRLILNARFATYLVAIAVFAAIAWQLRKEYGAKHKALAVVVLCINILALLALNYEVVAYFSQRFQDYYNTPGSAATGQWQGLARARDFTYSALWMIYGAVILGIGFWRKLAFLRWQALVLIAFTIAKVFLYDLKNLSGALRVLSFIGLGVLLMAISFLYQKGWLRPSADED